MAEKHLIKRINQNFERMEKGERVRHIGHLAHKSGFHTIILRRFFPSLYQEQLEALETNQPAETDQNYGRAIKNR